MGKRRPAFRSLSFYFGSGAGAASSRFGTINASFEATSATPVSGLLDANLVAVAELFRPKHHL